MQTVLLRLFVVPLLTLALFFTSPHAKAEASFAELQPEMISTDPLIIKIYSKNLIPVLERGLMEEMVKFSAESNDFDINQVSVGLGAGSITVLAKGKARIKVAGIWVSDKFHATLTIGIGVEKWIAEAYLIHSEVEFSNDLMDALKRAFTEAVHKPINNALGNSLGEINGRNLKVELEESLGHPIDENCVANITISPEGLTFSCGASFGA